MRVYIFSMCVGVNIFECVHAHCSVHVCLCVWANVFWTAGLLVHGFLLSAPQGDSKGGDPSRGRTRGAVEFG